MILTVTLNPSVDISYKLDSLKTDTVNRVTDVTKTAGGKGLNVARVLNQLGETVGATGFLGGSLGKFIRSELYGYGIDDYFVTIHGETRNCIAILHGEEQTEVLENGPMVQDNEVSLFIEKFTSFVQQAQFITVSGSMPKGLSNGFYGTLLGTAEKYNTRVLLDTNGNLLKHSLQGKSKPLLIKPNQDELADLVGRNINGEEELLKALGDSLFTDVQWIVVTIGEKGAYVKHNDAIYRVKIPKVSVKNPVGSGDSVIAGFAAGLARNLPNEDLIRFGLSMGVLNAMEEKTGYVEVENVDWCMERIGLERING